MAQRFGNASQKKPFLIKRIAITKIAVGEFGGQILDISRKSDSLRVIAEARRIG